MSGRTREMDRAIREAEKQGWYLVPLKGRGGHHQLRHPKGGIVIASRSPSDHHALSNFWGDIRRAERQWGKE